MLKYDYELIFQEIKYQIDKAINTKDFELLETLQEDLVGLVKEVEKAKDKVNGR